jgi:LPXTG-motif cell wall-anchored protein
VAPEERSGSFSHDYTITTAPGAGSTVELRVYLPSDASFLLIDQVVALTCPPPSSARPILPDVQTETVGTRGWRVASGYMDVDASKATQPWTAYVYRDGAVTTYGPVQPGTKKSFLIDDRVRAGTLLTFEVVLVGPVRVDIGDEEVMGFIRPPISSAFELSSTNIPQGGTAFLSAVHFGHKMLVHVLLATFPLRSHQIVPPDAVRLGTFTTNGQGKGLFFVKIPANTSVGEHEIVAYSDAGDSAAVSFAVLATPEVAGPPSLAETGTHTAALTVLGFGLIVSGAGALALGRRRRAM